MRVHPCGNKTRLILITILFVCALTGAQTQSGAQSSEAPPIPFPVVPVIMEYEYVPHYFMQWLDDPHYARIEAAISDRVYTLTLTEKQSSRRVNYCNSEAKVDALTRAGVEARLTKIDYQETNRLGQLPAHEFSFNDERGQKIHWRFTLATPASERGAGLTPQEGGAGWLVIYRDLGSAAGEGTAAQIGNRVNEAPAWSEIAAPPYFIPYRGVYAEGIGIGVMPQGQESWRVIASPKELAQGGEWIIASDRGRERRLQIASMKGDEMTINEIAGRSSRGSLLNLQARRSGDGLWLRSVTLRSGAKTMRLAFTPDLNLAASSSIAFQIDQNGHNKIIHGSLSVERKGDATELRWQPKAPDWAKPHPLITRVTISAAGYKIEAR
ncbi:MAG: hypothetical protein AB1631_25755 [Acidobacteriota bacterium]